MAYVTDNILLVDNIVYNKTESVVTFAIRNSKSTIFPLLKQIIVVTFYCDTPKMDSRFCSLTKLCNNEDPIITN